MVYSAEPQTGARRILLIVPAYNESASLPALVAELNRLYPFANILIVDDGSTDATAAAAMRFPVRLISLPCNLGVGGAVQTGLKLAARDGYDVAVQIDGDGQHPATEVAKLLAAIGDPATDTVIGSRFLSGGGFRSTKSRRLGMRLFSFLLSALCGIKITDPTSGFRAWNRKAIGVLAEDYPEDYPEVEAIYLLHRAGLRVSEVPVQMAERTGGVSTIGAWEAVTYMIKVPLALLMTSLRKRGPHSVL